MDERRDPVRATDAAAKHLDMLRRQFGSLYLAAAAYNAGGGKVSRSLAKMERIRPAQGDAALEEVPEDDGSDGWSDDDFFRLHDTNLLKQETRDYVPKLIAAAIIAKEPARFGFTDLQPAPPFEADSIVVESMTGLDVVARLAGTSVATIRDLNPQYLRWATPPGRSSVVRVPKGTGSSAARAYDALPQSEHVTFATHVARKNETMTRVAKRYGVSLAALKEANPDVGRLRSGTRLLVPRGGGVSTAAARSIRAAEAAEYHKVRRGETATRIARRYGVTVAELKAWNRGKVAKNGRVTNGVRLLVSEPEGRSLAARTATGGAGKGKSASAKVKASRNVARAEGGSPASATTSTKANATSAARVRSHTVRRGDTLTGVAQRYGTSVAALRKANKLRGGDIRAGQRLKIPA
jgi:membrane-bound lytic murein transglycosylase D